MAFGRITIYWDIREFDSDIGSVLINRTNDEDGEMGSYSTIVTLDSGSPNYIGSYIGSSDLDKITSWYKIQVLDSGTGSSWSGSSDPIKPIENRLTDVKAVKDIARLNSNADIADYEILRFIDDTESEVYENYGNPVKKTYFQLDSSFGSVIYDFTGNNVPVHTVQEVRIDGRAVPLSEGSWSLGLSQGLIKFDSDLVIGSNSMNVSVDWIPKAFHTLATYMTALDLIDSSSIIDGEEVRNPLAVKLGRRIGSVSDSIRPKEVFRSSAYERWDERDGKFVYQRQFYDI